MPGSANSLYVADCRTESWLIPAFPGMLVSVKLICSLNLCISGTIDLFKAAYLRWDVVVFLLIIDQ